MRQPNLKGWVACDDRIPFKIQFTVSDQILAMASGIKLYMKG